jgi:hypothetical protein
MKLPVLLAAGLAFAPMAVHAQPVDEVLSNARAAAQCVPAADALASLKSRYGEVPFFIGNDADGSGVIVTQRPDDGSWTLLAISAGEGGVTMACMIGAGVAAFPAQPTQ